MVVYWQTLKSFMIDDTMRRSTMFLQKMMAAAAAAVLTAAVASGAVNGVRFNVAKGNKEATFNRMLEKDLETTGFVLSDPHERINDAYKQKYGTPGEKEYDPAYKAVLDTMGFFSVSNDEALRPLLLKEPSLGGFSPFNLYMYKIKGEDKTHVGHLTPETMLDITGVKDTGVRKAFIASFVALDKLVEQKIGGKVEYITYDKLPAESMMRFELKFDRPDDLTEFIDAFQERFEAAFEDHDYVIAGYKDFKEAYTDLDEDFGRYDAYWVYSLCHFRFSYELFNKGRPDAGVFAPCSMYMYVEKGAGVLHIGMPSLENWIAVLGIKDAQKVKHIHAIDDEIVAIMKKLGAVKK